MKIQMVPLDQIATNPWRDTELYPIDEEHVKELRQSIDDHEFFSSIKGRRVDGKVQIGCGHARIEAARKARLGSVPIFLADMDDDEMLRLMTDENALQAGANPGAVLNETVAVTRRLIDGLFDGTIVPPNVAKAFESKAGMERARSKLRNGTDAHLALGHNVIRAYLGQGNPDRAHRGERQIREAISALRQSGRYDDIIEAAMLKYAPPVNDAEPAKDTAVTKAKPAKPKRRLLDERCANLFDNEHQFHAFREAVTTPAAQKVIPVAKQYALAKEIMSTKDTPHGDSKFRKKVIGAPYIKKMVQVEVQDGMKAQREIDKEERERYLAEQREERIDAELYTAKASLRSLISAISKLIDLAEQFAGHPKLGGFSAKLDDLVRVIEQFSRKLKGGRK
jgi:ParB-like chromosome segregation protein Spo0J